MADQHETGTGVPAEDASLDQNASEASEGRAASVRDIMRRNREHGEDGEPAAAAQELSALSDDELLAKWRATESGSALHELIAAELESRNLDH